MLERLALSSYDIYIHLMINFIIITSRINASVTSLVHEFEPKTLNATVFPCSD